MRKNVIECSFGTDSWVILSPIEQSIKRKIEAVGTPLCDWDINIYRGVLTGYNEAFIIDSITKERLIAEDPKSAEIIRPILLSRCFLQYKRVFFVGFYYSRTLKYSYRRWHFQTHLLPNQQVILGWRFL